MPDTQKSSQFADYNILRKFRFELIEGWSKEDNNKTTEDNKVLTKETIMKYNRIMVDGELHEAMIVQGEFLTPQVFQSC